MDSEIPQYLCRLLSSILTPSKAKAIPLDNYFRIPKPAKAPDGSPRDMLKGFQSMRSKQMVQAATRDAPSHHIEGGDLTFFNNLTRSTMFWWQSLRPVTQHLRHHEVVYRWGPGCKLTVLHDEESPAAAPIGCGETLQDTGTVYPRGPTGKHSRCGPPTIDPDVGCEKCPTLLPESQNRGSGVKPGRHMRLVSSTGTVLTNCRTLTPLL
ncbi:Hypothetical predicted protein [Pelobates cultripes]|uniref:Uncharacterized protein n=1 Tax=Pelobates cultripes TaxID=61616 RepID=A0AAD1T815_PELCU|nr:Hypothetical predicted protein [Pelobates cultripes]